MRLRSILMAVVCSVLLQSLLLAAERTVPSESHAGVVKLVVEIAMENFWGNAVGLDGKVLEPSSEKERQTLPIPYVEAERIVQDAFDYGFAMRCEVEWRPAYLMYMQLERRKSWTEKQVAFIGILFGVAQGMLFADDLGDCDAETRAIVQSRLDKEYARLEVELE